MIAFTTLMCFAYMYMSLWSNDVAAGHEHAGCPSAGTCAHISWEYTSHAWDAKVSPDYASCWPVAYTIFQSKDTSKGS